MKKLLFILLLIPARVLGHGGDGHDHKETTEATAITYFSSEASSDKYEVFLKYNPIVPGEEATLRLFISEFLTNKPLDSAALALSCEEDSTIKFIITRADRGYYEVRTTFPKARVYSLVVKIHGKLGSDWLLLQRIEPGRTLPHAEEEPTTFFTSAPFLFFAGLLAGLALMFILMKARYRKAATVMLIFFYMVPVSGLQPIHAHEGHGAEPGGPNFSASFQVPKETQFLFDVYTHAVATGDFTETTKLFGTVISASNGQAIVQSPQTGKLVALNVRVGEQVRQGQVLGVVEPTIDAGNMVNILTEKNNVEAELQAARKEYERLKSIEDIAAKRDVAEAEARYRKASENHKLLQQLHSGQANASGTLTLKSPITGVIGNFTLAIGSTVNANEALFTVTNLSKVYVEAQVFDKDAERVNEGKNFLVECANADEHKTAEVKLIAPAQTINPANQTQRVIFEMINPDGDFKIGEFVNVRVYAAQPSRAIALPNSAISEINGKPVVFIKDKAEQYSLAYISPGHNNGTHTLINKGVEEGERVVVNGTYQMKMIYLNQ